MWYASTPNSLDQNQGVRSGHPSRSVNEFRRVRMSDQTTDHLRSAIRLTMMHWSAKPPGQDTSNLLGGAANAVQHAIEHYAVEWDYRIPVQKPRKSSRFELRRLD